MRILHIDLDAFYCAVEEQKNPKLHGNPFAVGGKPEHRGVVSSCSYPARKQGVRSAMPTAKALQLCPSLILLGGSRPLYQKKSNQVMSSLKEFSDSIEQISIDEAFLDISDTGKNDLELAKTIQKYIFTKTGLPCSIGVASNKLVAKIATDVGKASSKAEDYPNAIQIVPPGEEANFLAPLPTLMLWGIGPKTSQYLEELGIFTIGELAKWPLKDLVNKLGQHGYELSQRARGIDKREIVTYREAKSFSQEITFSKDVGDIEKIKKVLDTQSESVASSLEKTNQQATTIKIKIRWPDFTTITRQNTLLHPTNDKKEIFQVGLQLLMENWRRGQKVRLIGLGVSGLQAPSRQLSLWDDIDHEKQARLEAALFNVRKKYGKFSISKGIPNISESNSLTND